ncbi:hypothetical protein ACTFIR_011861 [Dictyostelium discoideum]
MKISYSVTIESDDEYITLSTQNINGEIGVFVDFEGINKEITIEVAINNNDFIHLSILEGRMETYVILIQGSKWGEDALKIRFDIKKKHQINTPNKNNLLYKRQRY